MKYMLSIILEDMKEPLSYLPVGCLIGLFMTAMLMLADTGLRHKKHSASFFISWFLLSAYGAVTMIQAYFSREAGSRVSGIDLEFFSTWGLTIKSHALMLENLAMFVPLGILLPCVVNLKHWWQYVAAGALFSFFIEGMQFLTGRGFCQIDDLLMNTLGTLAGYMLYKAADGIFSAVSGRNALK